MASRRNQTEICEEAFASALQIDKVDHLKYLKVSNFIDLLREII